VRLSDDLHCAFCFDHLCSTVLNVARPSQRGDDKAVADRAIRLWHSRSRLPESIELWLEASFVKSQQTNDIRVKLAVCVCHAAGSQLVETRDPTPSRRPSRTGSNSGIPISRVRLFPSDSPVIRLHGPLKHDFDMLLSPAICSSDGVGLA
jgi:hypothetical protein